MHRRNIGILAVILGAAMLVASARAAIVPWNNPAGGDFNTGANWVGGVVPGAGDEALFDLGNQQGPYTVTSGSTLDLTNLTVGTDFVRLDLAGQLSISNSLTVSGVPGQGAVLEQVQGAIQADFVSVADSQGWGTFIVGDLVEVLGTTMIANTFGPTVAGSLVINTALSDFRELTPGETYIGAGTGADGTLVVGNGGYAEFYGNFYVGTDGGEADLIVGNGGQLINLSGPYSTSVGRGVSGNGTASVAGAGSHWDVQSLLFQIGTAQGAGRLDVESGGLVTCGTLSIGGGTDGSGEVYVTGVGTSLETSQSIQVAGSGGAGVLSITDGASLLNNSLTQVVVGTGTGSQGSMVVSGAGSTLTHAGSMQVGLSDGFGSLLVGNEGTVTISSILGIGYFTGGSGEVTVNGASLVSNDLRIGYDTNSTGALRLLNSAYAQASGFHQLGRVTDSRGYIRVDGSTLDGGGGSPLRVGESGLGEMVVVNGGEVYSASGGLGLGVGGLGVAAVIGQGSVWQLSGPLSVGSAGATAYLSLREGGEIIASSVNVFGPSGGSTHAQLSGVGAIIGPVTSSGTVAPANGSLYPGTLAITGNYTQTADGRLFAQLSDNTTQLDIGGAASLNGELWITGPDAFTVPAPGSLYPLLSANSVTGAFTSVVQPAGNDGLVYEVVPGKGPSLDILVSADCNHNGQADVKDIDQQISEDVDENGIPDECVDPFPSCGSNRWFCGANWPLGEVPGEFSADFHVTMGAGDNLCLDDDVTIQSLILRNGSLLDMSDPNGGICDGDLVLDGVEGMTIDDSTLSIGPGRRVDFGLGGTTNLWLRRGGTIDANGSTIDVGDVLIESGGSYRSATTVTSPPNTALLRTGDITLRSGFSATASELNLTGDMEVIADGDVVIDGTNAPCDCGAASRSTRADVTPPVFRNDGRRFIAVDNIGLKGSINITIQSALVLGGNFENESVCPSCADLSGGTVQLNGPGLFNGEPRGGVFPQRFEVASPDMGPGVEIPDQPWALDTLEIGAGVETTFDDRFDNDGAGQVPCSEALYVRHLIIGAGASAVARHVRLYYDTLTIDPTGTLTEIGCGVASEIACIVAAPAGPEPSPQPKNRYLSFAPGNPGSPTAIRVTLTNLNGFPSFNGQVRWVGPPVLRPLGNGGQFWAAPLQCAPHFMEWDNVGVVHVYGAEVAPSSAYDVQVIHANCDGALNQGASYSSPLSVLTGKWGDVQAPYGAGQPTFADISAIVATFTGNASSIGKARAQLQPNVPNPAVAISFADISACVSAFRGTPYSFVGPSACP